MKKIIILLLCCGVLVSMVGCGGNTAPPPIESPPTIASETAIIETPTETTPPVTAVESTEKEKVPFPTESKAQATEPTTTVTEPPTTEKPKEETKPTATEKQTESSAAEKPKDNGCITIVETDDPPKEEIIIPPKPSADLVAQKVAEYINQFRTEQGDVTATVIPGLTEYCNYRCTQLKTNFAHDTTDQRVAAEALQYGEYVDWSLYGIVGEENYYTANVSEAIGKGNWGGTAESYHGMIYGRIRRYFTAHSNLTVGNITSKDIEDFYDWMFESGVVANTVIHYHTVLHSAFKRAFKDGLIDANPFDRIDRPKKNKFTGENYSEDELITMLGLFRGDVIYPAVVLAGGLGLRRSEALGARWSRVDWDKRTILLDTKVIEYKEDGKVIVEPIEEMKNKSSRRTLPIPDPVYEMLCEEREKQDLYRRMFKGSYNRKFDDYICVDQLGELLRPNRVTQRFSDLIERYDLRKIRFHDLRHTFASILINQDVPLLNVSAFLGHSDLATTANIYAHLDKSKKQESADIISNIFNKAKE